MSISTDFAKAIQDKFNADPKALHNQFPLQHKPYLLTVESGKVYDRIVIERAGDMYSRSVHAFIKPSTGELIKASGWRAPQKSAKGVLAVRYLLSDPNGYRRAIEDADWTGGYLYADH